MRNYTLDFIKGVSLFLIIAMHSGYFVPHSLTLNFIFNTLMRFAVPFFFIALGFFLFNRISSSKNPEKVLRSYLKKSLIWFIGATAICLSVDFFILHPLSKTDFVWNYPWTLTPLYADFFYYGNNTMSSFHLWFLIAMFWAITIIYLICRKNPQNLKKLIIAALIIHLIGLFGLNQPYSQFFELPLFTRDGLFFALFYICIGGCFSLYDLKLGRFIPNKLLLPSILIFTLLMLAERWFLAQPHLDIETMNWGDYGKLWGDYFILTIPLVLIIFQYALTNPGLFKNNILTKMGSKSLGIYIIHLPVLNLVTVILKNHYQSAANNLWVQLMLPLLVLFVSYYLYLSYIKIKDFIFPRKGSAPHTAKPALLKHPS